MFDRMMGALLAHKQLVIVGLAITGLAFYTGVPSNMAAFAEHDTGVFWFFRSDNIEIVSERFTDTFDFGFDLSEDSLEVGPFSFAFDDHRNTSPP